jgi:hypothetical protein
MIACLRPAPFYHGIDHIEALLKLLHDDFPALAKDRAAAKRKAEDAEVAPTAQRNIIPPWPPRPLPSSCFVAISRLRSRFISPRVGDTGFELCDKIDPARESDREQCGS